MSEISNHNFVFHLFFFFPPSISFANRIGFIVNRILVPMLMQSMSLIDRKDASVKDIDVAMKLGCGHPSKFILFCFVSDVFNGMVDDPIFLFFSFLF